MKFKKPKIKIGTKLIIAYLTVIGLFMVFFYFNNARLQEQSTDEFVANEIAQDKMSFEHAKERDINMLSTTLTAIIQNPDTKEIYLQKDRDKLYAYNEALFSELKNKYGITHWYFILPDGHTFLRMHQKDQYNDMIDRETFKQAQKTGQVAAGIELGKTAYALRVVMPYYDNGQLIGYVELGEEINHFLNILKGNSKNEYSLIADKSFLSQADWVSVRQTEGLRNNWDDLTEHVVVGITADTSITRNCFTQEALKQLKDNDLNFQLFREDNGYFGCGGFEIKDIKGQHTGLVMLVTDINNHVALLNENNKTAMIYRGSILVLALLISLGFSRLLLRSIRKLRDGSIRISQGDLDYRVDIQTGDEIEELGLEFNKMADNLSARTKELEKTNVNIETQVREKIEEISESMKEMEKFNNIVVGRELRMIELKKRIQELEAEKEELLKKI